MKSLIRTIAILTVLNLATTSSALARNTAEEKTQEAIEKAMTLAEKEAMVAQKVAETAQRRAEVAQRQTEAVLTQKDELAASVNETLTALTQLTRRTLEYGRGGRVLVIPTAEEIKPQDLVTIMEDMNVMARIFDKKLAQSYLVQRQSFSSRIRISRDSRSTGAMYVQGYGTLFLTKVDFPLSPPPEIPEEKKTEESTDPIWDQTKQEIYMPEDVSRSRRRSGRSEEIPSYDAEKVDDLKRTLTRTLKHAANIRGLKPDEWVNVTVISSAALTIRAKKSDIDAFSEGELDFDKFRQKVVIFTYPYLPGIERGRTPSINVRNPIAR